MLEALFHNRMLHLGLVLLTLLLSFALALMAVFGSIYQNIAYLVFFIGFIWAVDGCRRATRASAPEQTLFAAIGGIVVCCVVDTVGGDFFDRILR